MQRVIEMTEVPIVGTMYLVPCVAWYEEEVGEGKPVWLPVYGGFHQDKEIIRFDAKHWHLDWRFMNQRHLSARGCDLSFLRGRQFGVPVCAGDGVLNVSIQKPIEKRLKCVRVMPSYPMKLAAWIDELSDAYADEKVIRAGKCNLCPHKMLPLDGTGDDPERTVCRGHGLTWNLKTGEMAR